MLCIGLTGNIASGKSTALNHFQTLGACIINADHVARELTQANQPALTEIAQHFGQHIILANGELDRRQLREIIFADVKQRIWLEQLLHPLIKHAIQHRLSRCSNAPYSVIEIPLLKSKQDYPYLDRVLVLLAPTHIQVRRVMERDNCDEQQALSILASQPDDASRRSLADDLIINDGSANNLLKTINQLHEKYLQLAAKKSS
ncbi:dephospho-CoA kinase [Legionella dresdenensis]|uniref:Dephospho-CoA kinase n=1 Tax=Legionella dresdenensis TaxID=450200 RepID=A0ABV8CB76_9GAMM